MGPRFELQIYALREHNKTIKVLKEMLWPHLGIKNSIYLGVMKCLRIIYALCIPVFIPFTNFATSSSVHADTTLMSTVNQAMSSNTFLKAWTDIQKFPVPTNQRNSFEMQMHLTFSSFLRNNQGYKTLMESTERGFKENEQIQDAIQKNPIIGAKVMETIMAEAAKTNLVLFNENHYYPQHRILVYEFLPKLWALGYTYFALEGLGDGQDEELNKRDGFPTIKTGFYTREQNFANLLRYAKDLGFTFIGYENFDNQKDREIGQAENLYNKSFALHKDAKIVVLAGIDHILEAPTSSGKKWLAAILKEKYNLDPLSITQTHLNLYRKYSLHDYQLISREDLSSVPNIPSVDYFVLNNRPEYLNIWKEKYPFVNTRNQEIQLSVFYQKEIVREDALSELIPYFSAIVKPGDKLDIPYNLNEAIVVAIYNNQGEIIDKMKFNFNRE